MSVIELVNSRMSSNLIIIPDTSASGFPQYLEHVNLQDSIETLSYKVIWQHKHLVQKIINHQKIVLLM